MCSSLMKTCIVDTKQMKTCIDDTKLKILQKFGKIDIHDIKILSNFSYVYYAKTLIKTLILFYTNLSGSPILLNNIVARYPCTMMYTTACNALVRRYPAVQDRVVFTDGKSPSYFVSNLSEYCSITV